MPKVQVPKDEDGTPNPFKFSKEVYWDRRRKGLHGQVHPAGSREQRYDQRVMERRMQADRLAKLKKGVKRERKNSKSPAKSV